MVAANSDVRPEFTTRLKTALPIIQWLPSYRSEWFRPDLSASPNIDLAGVQMLGQLHKELQTTGIVFRLAGVHGTVRDLLQVEELDGVIEGAAARMKVADLVRGRTEA
jgi:MFS superfamily sulfate permease-like transporter